MNSTVYKTWLAMFYFERTWKNVVFFIFVLSLCLISGYFIGNAKTYKPVSIGLIFLIVLLIFSKDYAAYLFLFVLFPFKMLLILFYGDQSVAAAIRDGILVLLTLRLFLDVSLQRKQILPSPISYPIYAFIAYSTTYLMVTEKGVVSIIDYRSKMLYIAMFFLTVHYVNSHARLKKLLYLMIGIPFFIALLGIIQQIIGLERFIKFGILPSYGFRTQGYFLVSGNRMFSNAIVGGLIPSAKLVIFFSLCLFHLRQKSFWFLIMAGISVVSLVFTFSRSAFITMIAGMIWLSLFVKWRNLVIGVLIGLIAFFTFTSGWVYDRFEDIFHPFSNTSFSGRIYSYVMALKEFKQLVFGAGFGKVGGALKSWDQGTTLTDTYYVTIFMTLGLPGFIIFIWIGITLVIKGFLNILKMKTPLYRLLALGAYTFVCQQYLAIVAVDSFHTLPAAFYFWTCAGLLFSLEKLDRSMVEETTKENIPVEPTDFIPVVNPT